MQRLLPIIACLLAVTGLSTTAGAATAQQDRMTTCNADAKTKALKGDERKAFMKSCLSGNDAAPAVANSQQNKMKSCNAEAAKQTLKGDARKQFMSTCLKAK